MDFSTLISIVVGLCTFAIINHFIKRLHENSPIAVGPEYIVEKPYFKFNWYGIFWQMHGVASKRHEAQIRGYDSGTRHELTIDKKEIVMRSYDYKHEWTLLKFDGVECNESLYGDETNLDKIKYPNASRLIKFLRIQRVD
jgi:hypothetical protein